MNDYEKEQARMNAWFDLVKPTTHWKDPINSICSTEEVGPITDAIIYFTATVPTFVKLGVMIRDEGRFKKGDQLWRVTADGYRRGPAGDH